MIDNQLLQPNTRNILIKTLQIHQGNLSLIEGASRSPSFLKNPPLPRPLPQEIPSYIFKTKEAKDATAKLKKELRINWDYKKTPDIDVSEQTNQLHQAVIAGEIEKVKQLLQTGTDPNLQDTNGRSTLHITIKYRQIDILSYLLIEVSELNLNLTDFRLRTPLHYACHSDKHENQFTEDERFNFMAVCSLLLGDSRLLLDLKDKRGRTPLNLACISNLFSVVNMLVARNANVNISDNKKRSPLHYATENGQKDIVEALITAKASIEAKDDSGTRAIHIAAKKNYLAICRYLKKKGANLDCLDNKGKSPHDLTKDKEIRWLIEERFTAATHPFKIDFVNHPVLRKAKIGMSMCPGRNKKNWRRDLSEDIKKLKSVGIQTVVTLVCQAELNSMGIPDLLMRLNEHDIETVHLQIVDKWIPSRMEDLVAIVQMMLVRIERQRAILVHCNGGKGRTGLVVVATLVALGVSVDEAVSVIRKARDGMIQNPAQLIYVRLFQSYWESLSKPNNDPKKITKT